MVKRISLLGIIGFLSLNTLQAQDIRLYRDTVLVDDSPYAVFQSLGTVTKQMYSIKNLSGDPLILIDQSQLRDAEGNALMRFMFTAYPEKKAFMPVSLQFRRKMMRSLVAYNMIQKGELSEKNVDLFCKQYPGYFETNRIQAVNEKNFTSNEIKTTVSDNTPKKVTEIAEPSVPSKLNNQANEAPFDTTAIAAIDNTIPTPTQKVVEEQSPLVEPTKETLINYSIVNRDIDQPIYLDGNVIRQDFEEVGLYTVEQVKPDAGTPYHIISLYDIRHDFVGEAIVSGSEKIYEFKTFKDGKIRRANVQEGDIYETVKQFAATLAHLLYL